MTQRYCYHAPSTRPGERRKCLTRYQALVLTRTYQVQQCGHCGTWHTVQRHQHRPQAPRPSTQPTQPSSPAPSAEAQALAQAHGAQVLAALRASFNAHSTQEV